MLRGLRAYMVLAVMMVPALRAGAQNAAVHQRMLDSIANPPMAEASALVFDREDINVGRISEDDTPSEWVFSFRNIGDEPVVITRVESSCGCVVAGFDRNPIQPGGSGRVTVTYKPKGHPGRLSQRIYLFTNLSKRATARLTLSGEVTPTANQWVGYPVVMGEVRAKRSSLSFGTVGAGTRKTERIECVNTGRKPLRLHTAEEMLPAWLSFRTDPEVIEPGESADLVVSLDGGQLPAGMKGTLRYVLMIDGIEGRPSQRSLSISVEVK